MTTWRSRPYAAGDEDQIRHLFERVFGRPMSVEHWRWKMRGLPSPADNEWVAEADGRIVGHYAVTPVPFQVDGVRVIVPHGCDAMTDPEFRRTGILTALVTEANAAWRRVGAPFQIGFGTEAWGSLSVRLGWNPILRLQWLRLWLRPVTAVLRRIGAARRAAIVPLAADRVPPHRGDCGEIVMVSPGDDCFDILWKQLRPRLTTAAVRDASWTAWRHATPGKHQRVLMLTDHGEPRGYVAYRIADTGGARRAVVEDLFTAPGDDRTAAALLAAARSQWRACRVESVRALVVPGSALERPYRHAGFCPARNGYDFSVIPLAMAPPSPDRWFLTGVESDVL